MKTTSTTHNRPSLSTVATRRHVSSVAQGPLPSCRPLQDWANMPHPVVRGLRSDLRALVRYFSRYGSEAMMALLWASLIPSMTVLGTLAGY